MKTRILTIVVAAVILWSGMGIAANFAIDLIVPSSTAVLYSLFKIENGEFPTKPETVNDVLSFGTLELDTQYGVFRPANARYFAIDLNPNGAGSGAVDQVTFTYQNGNNPNGTGNGLGDRGKLTIVKAKKDKTEDILDSRLLMNAGVSSFSETQFVGGWPRVYVGLNSGDEDDATYTNLSNAQVFSLADTPGSYAGLLTISAVIK